MINLLVWIYRLLEGWQKEVARAAGIVCAAVALVDYVNSLWTDLFARCDALISDATGGAIDFSVMGLANACFPLDSMLSMLVAYGTLRLLCAAIRIIKSFVPTIA